MPPKTQEPVFNTHLAELLRARLPGWPQVIAEATQVFPKSSKAPDVLAEAPGGLPVVLECKFDGKKTNVSAVEQQAENRLGELTGSGREVEQAVAVLYPEKHLREHPGSEKAALESAGFSFAVYSRSGSGASLRFPEAGWLTGHIDDLADFVENVAVSEQQIQSALTLFANEIGSAANILLKAEGEDSTLANLGKVLNQEPGEQTTRMAMAILLNALVFQTTLPQHHPSVKSIDQLVAVANSQQRKLSQGDVLDVWQHILNEINYWPIFAIATDILYSINDQNAVISVLESLATSVGRLSQFSAQTVQDLAGQIFGRLISDRKFLATFYTLPASATLLAELAVSRLGIDWSDREAVTSLKIADFACGTGALLSAAYRQVAQRVRRKGIDDKTIHKAMLQDVLVGADIMPSAVHITAAMLSSVHPKIEYTSTLTHVMPYGEQADKSIKIGSLHLLEGNKVQTLWGDGSRALANLGEVEHSTLSVAHGEVDLVIMNPPFTRSTKHVDESTGVPIPSFAGFGTEEEEQYKMASELEKIYKKTSGPTAQHGNAGLATAFIDLAVAKAKPGGVVALVLPATFAAGKSWQKSRETIARTCEDICVVSISAGIAQKSAFSADTNMAEVLVVATRRSEDIMDESHKEEHWDWITLAERPQSPVSAVEMAKSCSQLGMFTLGDIEYGLVSKAKFGVSLEQIHNLEIAEIALGMEHGEEVVFGLPDNQAGDVLSLSLCSLGEIGERGTYHLDIIGEKKSKSSDDPRGPFDKHDLPPKTLVHYPMLWTHHHEKEKKLVVAPDSEGKIRKDSEGNTIEGMADKAAKVWQKATRLHFSVDFGLASQPLSACLTEKRCIGGRAWPNFMLYDKTAAEQDETAVQPDEKMEWVYPVLLWCNTTLGLLSRWMHGTKQQTNGRTRTTITRLPDLKVLDPRTLSVEQLNEAEQIFKNFKDKEFLPANEAYRDDARIALDEDVLVRLLGQPEEVMDWLEVVRDQWCREPTVHGGKGTQPTTTPAP